MYVQTASFSPKGPRNSPQVNLPIFFLDFVIGLLSRDGFSGSTQRKKQVIARRDDGEQTEVTTGLKRKIAEEG